MQAVGVSGGVARRFCDLTGTNWQQRRHVREEQ
jgi:hypothetical protein